MWLYTETTTTVVYTLPRHVALTLFPSLSSKFHQDALSFMCRTCSWQIGLPRGPGSFKTQQYPASSIDIVQVPPRCTKFQVRNLLQAHGTCSGPGGFHVPSVPFQFHRYRPCLTKMHRVSGAELAPGSWTLPRSVGPTFDPQSLAYPLGRPPLKTNICPPIDL